MYNLQKEAIVLVYISKLPSVQMYLLCMIEITLTSSGTEQAASM